MIERRSISQFALSQIVIKAGEIRFCNMIKLRLYPNENKSSRMEYVATQLT